LRYLQDDLCELTIMSDGGFDISGVQLSGSAAIVLHVLAASYK